MFNISKFQNFKISRFYNFNFNIQNFKNSKIQNFRISNFEISKFIILRFQKIKIQHFKLSKFEFTHFRIIRLGFNFGVPNKRKVATKTIPYERYKEILFQKVASGYLLHFAHEGSSKNAL